MYRASIELPNVSNLCVCACDNSEEFVNQMMLDMEHKFRTSECFSLVLQSIVERHLEELFLRRG